MQNTNFGMSRLHRQTIGFFDSLQRVVIGGRSDIVPALNRSQGRNVRELRSRVFSDQLKTLLHASIAHQAIWNKQPSQDRKK